MMMMMMTVVTAVLVMMMMVDVAAVVAAVVAFTAWAAAAATGSITLLRLGTDYGHASFCCWFAIIVALRCDSILANWLSICQNNEA